MICSAFRISPTHFIYFIAEAEDLFSITYRLFLQYSSITSNFPVRLFYYNPLLLQIVYCHQKMLPGFFQNIQAPIPAASPGRLRFYIQKYFVIILFSTFFNVSIHAIIYKSASEKDCLLSI